MIASLGGSVQTGGIHFSGNVQILGDVVHGKKAHPTPSIPAIHQLPSPPADFTGREKELQDLSSNLSEGGTGAIFGLRGMGGVGKTTLAVKLADELKPAYPDAQIYLDLKGVDPQPLSTVRAMAHVIRSFHPEIRFPEGLDDMTALYRSVLHGKRCLLFMDNAASREQVEPLMPPSGSLLLVTSRFRFVLPGLVARDLDELPSADARDLLLRIAPRLGDKANEIADLCGHLPLALRLAGSVLAERLDLSPLDYARRLKAGTALGPVDASLALSYELLDEQRRRLWRQLSVFPRRFDAVDAAAIWDLEIDPARDALWEFVRCSLIQWDVNEASYRFHDLARQFANRRLEPAERERGNWNLLLEAWEEVWLKSIMGPAARRARSVASARPAEVILGSLSRRRYVFSRLKTSKTRQSYIGSLGLQ